MRLVRYRPGITGETARTVHVVPLPTDEQAGAVGALCGAALMLDNIETRDADHSIAVALGAA